MNWAREIWEDIYTVRMSEIWRRGEVAGKKAK